MHADKDRAMICGSKDMIDDTAKLMKQFGLSEGSNSTPAEFVVEKSFVG
jgi:ferredoxin--NADP+ reductase